MKVNVTHTTVYWCLLPVADPEKKLGRADTRLNQRGRDPHIFSLQKYTMFCLEYKTVDELYSDKIEKE
jgi:hypothetical protein